MKQSLDDWLLRISGIHPVGWDLGLERVSSVGDALGILHPAGKVVLVAGTNGKGSTCEFLTRFALEAGARVGTSTSPHLHQFNERIRIDGQPVADEVIVSAFEKIDAARGDTTLTYFEFSSLAAMLIFNEQGLDLAVLEVGLGGRLDAMNIVAPDLCVITSIALDHQDWLGDTREAIAVEKAGIMRQGVSCLVADDDMPKALSDEAGRLGASLEAVQPTSGADKPSQLPAMSFALAKRAAELLELDVGDDCARAIARDTRLTGRRSWADGPCPVLLDVAHNPAAARSLSDYLRELDINGRIHALFGAYRDKDIEAVTGCFSNLIQTWHLAGMDEERAETAERLADRLAADAHGQAYSYDSISSAIGAIDSVAGEQDLIVVFGSFPVVAEALKHYALTSDK